MGKVYDIPSDVEAEEGQVMMEGSDGACISFTPNAAVETSDRLLVGGMKAEGQRVAARNAEARRSPPEPADEK
jgi:hypothetical protein